MRGHYPHVTLRACLLPREQAAVYPHTQGTPFVPKITRGADATGRIWAFGLFARSAVAHPDDKRMGHTRMRGI